MFDGILGKYRGSNYTIELKEDAKPFPTIHEPTLTKEVTRLIRLGVLKKNNNHQRAAPTFIIAKINGTVSFISDFRELNKRIRRTTFPNPKHSRFIT